MLDKQNGTIVFLLGAGAAKDLGAPVMRDFMLAAATRRFACPKALQKDYERLFEFRGECLPMSYVFNRWWENIEDLFTQVHLRTLITPEKAGILDSFRRVIWDVYRQPRIPRLKAQNAPPLDHYGYEFFAEYILWLAHRGIRGKGPRPVILTTNYDISLEFELVVRGAIILYSGLRDCDRHHGLYAQFDHFDWNLSRELLPIEVVKLHGSVNWFTDKAQKGSAFCNLQLPVPEHVRPEAFTVPERKWRQGEIGAQFGLEVQGEKVSGLLGADLGTPLIIPPLLGKVAINKTIRSQWQRAVDAIREAWQLVIAGYSFPATDTFMERLLAEGCRENQRLSRAVIQCYCGDEELRARVRSVFAPGWERQNVAWVAGDFASAAKSLSTNRAKGGDPYDVAGALASMKF